MDSGHQHERYLHVLEMVHVFQLPTPFRPEHGDMCLVNEDLMKPALVLLMIHPVPKFFLHGLVAGNQHEPSSVTQFSILGYASVRNAIMSTLGLVAVHEALVEAYHHDDLGWMSTGGD